MKIIMNAAEMIRDEIWFVPYMTRKLVSLNIHSGEVRVRASIDMQGPIDKNQVLSIAKWNDSLFILPAFGHEIYEYNTISEKLNVISIRNSCIEASNKVFFISLYVLKDRLYILGYQYVGIAIINLNDFSIDFVNVDDFQLPLEKSKGCFGKQLYEYNGILYIPFDGVDGWLEFNTENHQYKRVILSEKHEGYSAIAIKNNILYATPRYEGNLLRYDLVSGKHEKRRINDKAIRSFCAISVEDKIILHKDDEIFSTDIQEWNDMVIEDNNYCFVKNCKEYKLTLDTEGILKIISDKEYIFDINQVTENDNLQKELNCEKCDTVNVVLERDVFCLTDFIARLKC